LSTVVGFKDAEVEVGREDGGALAVSAMGATGAGTVSAVLGLTGSSMSGDSIETGPTGDGSEIGALDGVDTHPEDWIGCGSVTLEGTAASTTDTIMGFSSCVGCAIAFVEDDDNSDSSPVTPERFRCGSGTTVEEVEGAAAADTDFFSARIK
jgi:hypothetical protein